jgi:hypothetical protein
MVRGISETGSCSEVAGTLAVASVAAANVLLGVSLARMAGVCDAIPAERISSVFG